MSLREGDTPVKIAFASLFKHGSGPPTDTDTQTSMLDIDNQNTGVHGDDDNHTYDDSYYYYYYYYYGGGPWLLHRNSVALCILY